MLPARNNSSLPNMDDDASSSYPSHSTASHKQVVPSLQDQRKQPRVDRRLSSVGTFPDISQPFDPDAWSKLAAQATISRSTHSDWHTTNTGVCPDDLIPHEFALRARSSDNLTFQRQSFPSQHRVLFSRYHSEPDIRKVAAQAEPSHNSFPGATGAQTRRRRRSSQHGITPVLAFPNSAIISADRRLDTVDTVYGSSWAHSLPDPLQGETVTVLTRGAHPCDRDRSWSITHHINELLFF